MIVTLYMLNSMSNSFRTLCRPSFAFYTSSVIRTLQFISLCPRRLCVTIECVRSRDQKPYLHNKTKGGICIKIEFNPQRNISLLQHGRRFFGYSSNMAAVTSCEHTLLAQLITNPPMSPHQPRSQGLSSPHPFGVRLVSTFDFDLICCDSV